MAKKTDEEIAEAIDKAIEAIVKKLNDKETKGTIADLIKLLQLREEVAVKPKQMIRAMWVDECELIPKDQ